MTDWPRLCNDVTIRLLFIALSIILVATLGPTVAVIVILLMALLLCWLVIVGKYAKSLLNILWRKVPAPSGHIWLRVPLKVLWILLMYLTVSFAVYKFQTAVRFDPSRHGMETMLVWEEIKAFKKDTKEFLKTTQEQKKKLQPGLQEREPN